MGATASARRRTSSTVLGLALAVLALLVGQRLTQAPVTAPRLPAAAVAHLDGGPAVELRGQPAAESQATEIRRRRRVRLDDVGPVLAAIAAIVVLLVARGRNTLRFVLLHPAHRRRRSFGTRVRGRAPPLAIV